MAESDRLDAENTKPSAVEPATPPPMEEPQHKLPHVTLAFEELKLKVEAVLFAADRPLEVAEIREFIGSVSLTDVRLALKDLGHDFANRSVQIIEVGRRYQMRTRPAYTETVSKIFSGKPRTLSKSAIETLAIVAYRQPVTRAEISALRQVDSSHLVTSLKEKELIVASGTRKEVGNPVEYKTTSQFLDVFGLTSIEELPRLRSLQLNPEAMDEVKQALDRIDAGLTQQTEEESSPDASDLNLIDAVDEPKSLPQPSEEHVEEKGKEDPSSPAPVFAADEEDEPSEEEEESASSPTLVFSADEEEEPSGEGEEASDEPTTRAPSRTPSVEDLLRPVPQRAGAEAAPNDDEDEVPEATSDTNTDAEDSDL